MSLSEAAIFADEFGLTHKTVFASTQGAKSAVFRSSKDGESLKDSKSSPPRSKEDFSITWYLNTNLTKVQIEYWS